MNNILNEYSTENAISPLDGRNRRKIEVLSHFFSEYALNKYRLKIEIHYLLFLSKQNIIVLKPNDTRILNLILSDFSISEYRKMKGIENKINHDVKAVEYYIREKLLEKKRGKLIPYIHLGLTSEDINNLSYACILKEFKENVLETQLGELLKQLSYLSKENAEIPLLGRTHGQPAVPTTVGKELSNYYYRVFKIYKKIKSFTFEGKCNGAVGNNNALKIALPQYNWVQLGRQFVTSFGLTPNLHTTQILPYDNWLEFFQLMSLANGILVDFSINMWQYIMLLVFTQKKTAQEVGSSTMPQKINPINFEHAEGSMQMANSLFNFFVQKLTFSRLQRDLSDSTIRRSFGEAFGYTILGWKSICTGLEKVYVNITHLTEELDNHWEVLSEAIQTVLRLKDDREAYEKLKNITRGKKINKAEYFRILKELGLHNEKELINLSPETYLGYASVLAKNIKN